MKLFLPLALSLSLLFLGGCASVCVGNNCSCPTGTACAFDACSSATAGCNLNCEANATCSGTCGTGCNVTCGGQACTHTVGEGANVTCTSGICTITCEGTCAAAATGGGTLNLTCRAGTKTAGGCI